MGLVLGSRLRLIRPDGALIEDGTGVGFLIHRVI